MALSLRLTLIDVRRPGEIMKDLRGFVLDKLRSIFQCSDSWLSEPAKARYRHLKSEETGKNSGVSCCSKQGRGWLKDRVDGRYSQVWLLPKPLPQVAIH
jgi:hypothetical protein